MYRSLSVLLLAFVLILPYAAASPLSETPERDRPPKPVQVFDVARGKVILTKDNDATYQAYARGWLKSATGLSAAMNPEPKCGYVFRVPLQKPVPFQAGRLAASAVEVFLFYCPGEQPRLLAIDLKHKAYLLDCKVEIGPFLQKIGVPTL